MIKDTNEQTDEEIYRVRAGKILSPGATVSEDLEYITLLVCECVHQLGAL